MSNDKNSRTSKSLTNAKISLAFMIAIFIVNFISRRYSLDGLGPEVMGMRSTIGTILSMLSLSELGISGSIGISLYKPLQNKNYEEVNEIISLQGWLYKRVFMVLTLGMAGVMLFVPKLFAGMEAPTMYVYLTLLSYYVGSMISFTVNYKSIIIGVDQKGYLVGRFSSTTTIIKTIIQVLIIKYVKQEPYLYWLLTDFIFIIINARVLNYITEKNYPWVKPDTSKGRIYYKKYPKVLKQVRQIFIYNIATFITSSLNPFIISQIVGLVSVALYDNYKNLVTNIRSVVVSTFSNMANGIASLVAEEDEDKSYRFFWEMVSLKYLVSAIVAFGFLNFSSPLVTLWLGGKYVLAFSTILVMTLVAYIDISRGVVDSYIGAYKLFQDSWAPIAQSVIYLSVAIICGRLYGFTGVLLGDLIGTVGIVVLWKPYNLFHNGFKRSIWDYWKGIIKFPIIGWSAIVIFSLAFRFLELDCSSWINLFMHVSWLTVLFVLCLWSSFYFISAGFRRMATRLYGIGFNACPRPVKKLLPPPVGH